MTLDLSSFASIREFASELSAKEKKVDLLICNAGIGWKGRDRTITCDGQARKPNLPVFFPSNTTFKGFGICKKIIIFVYVGCI